MENKTHLSSILMTFPGKSSRDGSAWLPLWMHGMDTAAIMIRLLNNWLADHFVSEDLIPAKEAEKLCRFVGMVHDIGKLTPVFAARILEPLGDVRQKLERYGLRIGYPKDYIDAKYSPHAKAGEAYLLNVNCPRGIASVVGAHHGRPQEFADDCRDDSHIYGQNYYENSAMRPVWEELRREWLAFSLEKSGYGSINELPEIRMPTQLLLSGLVIMADWLSSNTIYFPLISPEEAGSFGIYPTRAERAWARIQLPESWDPLCFSMDQDRFFTEFGFIPNAVQDMVIRAVNETEGGIYILEAQMGIGKTEAALAAAEVLASKCGCSGIFFGLPTQATANGLFTRLAAWAKNQAEETQLSIRLAHGMAELNEDYRALFRGCANGNEDGDKEESLVVHPWFNGRKQALLADFVIGTVDQLLMAALKQKHFMLRHLGLAGKVVILDECHAYDAYMNRYLDRTLNWLGAYSVPVIILSATLPEHRRTDLIRAYLNSDPEKGPEGWRTNRRYPLLTWTFGRELKQESLDKCFQNRKINICRITWEESISTLRDAVRAGGCCAMIVNTVRAAQNTAQKVKTALPEAEVILVHSRYTASDRSEIETKILKRVGKSSTSEKRAGLVVIGTQVLEQSLDIDFDIMITQLCPMDLLLQRIGRLHRHSRTRPKQLENPVCCILDDNGKTDSGSRAVYGDWLLKRTDALLPDEILLPGNIPLLVQETYREPDVSMLQDPELSKAWEIHSGRLKDKENKADNYRLTAPPKLGSRRVRTIDGLLNIEYPADGVHGEAAVRDGEPEITVLAMQEHNDGTVTFFPWQGSNATLSPSHAPDDLSARCIARQRLALPPEFSTYGREEATIRELENLNRKKLSEWQNSSWLNGELVLMFNTDNCAYLQGVCLHYTQEYGLTWDRKDDESGKQL